MKLAASGSRQHQPQPAPPQRPPQRPPRAPLLPLQVTPGARGRAPLLLSPQSAGEPMSAALVTFQAARPMDAGGRGPLRARGADNLLAAPRRLASAGASLGSRA